MTQAELLREVQRNYAPFDIGRSIWSRRLSIYDKRTIHKLYVQFMPGFNLDGCDNFAQLRNKLRLRQSLCAQGSTTISAKLILSKESLIVNGQTFAIENRVIGSNGYKSVRVPITIKGKTKRQWIRVDVLLALLGELPRT